MRTHLLLRIQLESYDDRFHVPCVIRYFFIYILNLVSLPDTYAALYVFLVIKRKKTLCFSFHTICIFIIELFLFFFTFFHIFFSIFHLLRFLLLLFSYFIFHIILLMIMCYGKIIKIW